MQCAFHASLTTSVHAIRTAWSMFITSPPTSRSRCGFDDTSSASDVDSESITVMENGKVLDQLSGTDGPTCGVTLDARGDLSVIPARRSVRKAAICLSWPPRLKSPALREGSSRVSRSRPGGAAV